MNRRFSLVAVATLIGGLVLGLAVIWRSADSRPVTANEGQAARVVVYKNPQCGCCGEWVKHLQGAGFEVEVHDTPDTKAIRSKLGVPATLGSCHTATVNGYVIEGHVPASDIQRLLADKTPVAGLAVPGMPEGSPGMEGPHPQAYDVIAFSTSGSERIFVTHSADGSRKIY